MHVDHALLSELTDGSAIDARLDALEATDVATDTRLDTAEATDVALDARLDAVEAKVAAQRIADLVEPWLYPHRLGGDQVFPDGTRESILGAIALGARIIDGGDVWIGADGSLLVNHDSTIDRTMVGSGLVTDETAMSWQTRLVDAGTWFAPAWSNSMKPLLFEDIVALCKQYGVAFTPESKGGLACATAMVAVIKRYGMEQSCIFESFSIGDLAPAVAAGIPTMWLAAATPVDPAAAAAAGVKYIGYDFTDDYTDGGTYASRAAYLAAIRAAGVKPLAYVVVKQSDWAAEVAIGAAAGSSDNPYYTAGKVPSKSADSFASQTFDHGMFNMSSPIGAASYRGEFVSDRLRLKTGAAYIVHQGWLQLPTSGSWQLDVRVTFDTVGGDATRWVSIPFCCMDDKLLNPEGGGTGRGYFALLRANGSMELWRRNGDASSTTLVGPTASAPITDGNSAVLRINVTPTTVKLSRVDVAAALGPVADSTWRGKHWDLHKTTAPVVSFSDVVLT